MVSSEEKKYSKKNASFGVYYDTVRSMFTSRRWKKLSNKQNTIYMFYLNDLKVIDAFTLIRKILDKK
jgi:hypothetical protein